MSNEKLEIVVSNSVDSRLPPAPEWLRSMKPQRSEATGDKHKPKIPRVPSMFRKIEQNHEHYDPSVVSVGPYHHGKKGLEEMEEVKLAMACDFVQDVENKYEGGKREQMYSEVQQIANEARRSYTKDATEQMNDEEFVKMMFIDGCFTLQFIHYFLRDYSKILKLMNDVAAFLVKRDLFLLENQLPFRVLKSLMGFRFKAEEGTKLIDEFITDIRGVQPSEMAAAEKSDQEVVAHLLELLHTRFTGHDLKDIDYAKGAFDHNRYSYRSAMELKEIGIRFRPSNTDLLTDLHYKSTFFGATIRLPRIVVDDLTKTLLLNLVAYEACPSGSANQGRLLVASYLCFLDSLIHDAEDVKELRWKGILINITGSDQEVANLFNEIASFLVSNPNAYRDFKIGIEEHRKRITKTWVAELFYTRFSGPGTLLLFISTLVTLILTVIQTQTALFPRSGGNTQG